MLKLLPAYEHTIIVRSREPGELAKCNIVVDVGAKYEPENNLYDHHQREFTGVLGDGFNTKLSSAGLVYKHFGKDIISHICSINNANSDTTIIDKHLIDTMYIRLYQGFIEHIDAIDNGISVSESPPLYYVSTTLSNRVGQLNPAWNQPQSDEVYNDNFKLAMELTCTEFLTTLDGLLNTWYNHTLLPVYYDIVCIMLFV